VNRTEHLKEVSFQMYSKGLTTRDISEVMETIVKVLLVTLVKSFMNKWKHDVNEL
jgi:transposase-like protein